MPWTVVIQDENGNDFNSKSVVLEFGSLPSGSGYPVCTLIENARYYDTVLNPVQTEAFLAELTTAKTKLTELQHLAEEVLEPHLYLRFLGD